MKNFCKYLNISTIEENWGLYVNTVGYDRVDPNQHYPKNSEHPINHCFSWNKGRILSEYQLIYISKGEGILNLHTRSRLEFRRAPVFFFTRVSGTVINQMPIRDGKNTG